MRVAIDIRRITEFGVGTYTRNAIRTLARLDHDNEYFLIGIPGKLGDIEAAAAEFHHRSGPTQRVLAWPAIWNCIAF